MTQYRTVSSPIGPITLAGRGDTLTHLLMVDHAHAPDATDWVRDDAAFGAAAEQLQAYFAGRLQTFELDIDLIGTEFQRRVWAALLTIPYGATCTYGQLASQIGAPTASRAVGLANGRNPISIIVPCHRVIGSNGSLTGYGGGIDRKRTLLDLERRWAPADPGAEPTLFD